MPLKKVTKPVEKPKEQPVKKSVQKEAPRPVIKKVIKKVVVKEELKPVVEKSVEIKPAEQAAMQKEKVILQRKDYNGIGLVGDNEIIHLFKVKHKQQRKKIGETLFNLIKDWITKN